MLGERALDDLVVRAGLIDSYAFSQAPKIQGNGSVSLGKALATLGIAEEEGVATPIAKGLQLELIGPDVPRVSEEVGALLSADFCRKKLISPIVKPDGSLFLSRSQTSNSFRESFEPSGLM